MGDTIIRRLEARLGIKFLDDTIPLLALSHYTLSNEVTHDGKDNEHSEQIGDAVMHLWGVRHVVQGNYRGLSKRELHALREIALSNNFIGRIALKNELLEFGIYGPKMRERIMSGTEESRVLLAADLFEAIVGALYEEQGDKAAFEFLTRMLDEPIRGIPLGHIQNHLRLRSENTGKSVNSYLKDLKASVARSGVLEAEITVTVTVKAKVGHTLFVTPPRPQVTDAFQDVRRFFAGRKIS